MASEMKTCQVASSSVAHELSPKVCDSQQMPRPSAGLLSD
jgi:hypothetical protein